MKYLIIGGTGLISTPITRFLIEKGEDVTLYNRGKTEVRLQQNIKVIHGDRTNFTTFEHQISQAGLFDFVIDMVCYRPEEAQSSVQVFKGRIHQYIFCSTVDVYGKPGLNLPYKENEIRNAITSYGRDKALCEDIFLEAHERNDFKVTIIRPAATYGEGGSIIHTFGWKTTYLDRIRKGKPIIVHGDGNSLWVMCHVDDVARAHIVACGNEKAYGKAYHTTGEEWMTWNQYHQKIAQAMNAPEPRIVHIPSDILHRLVPKQASITIFNFQYSNVFDNTTAKQDLGFRYTIPFVEGARRTIRWLEERNRIENSDFDPLEDRLIFLWEKMIASLEKEFSTLQS